MNFPSRRTLLLAGVLLSVPPAFRAGFFTDDYTHRVLLQNLVPGFHVSAPHLYEFVPRTPGVVLERIGQGALPWWSADDLALRFFRPLSGLSLGVDHWLFGLTPTPAHLHSLLWFAVLLSLASYLYAQLLPTRAALYATALFALAGHHVGAVGWIASRHVLLGSVFSLGALALHLRFRLRTALPTLAALLCSLCSSESGLAGLAMIVGYEAFLATEEQRERVRRVLPFVLLAGGYALFYRLGGYGIRSSGTYADPTGNPLGFLLGIPLRMSVLWGDALLAVTADLWAAEPVRPILGMFGLLGMVLLALLYRAAKLREESDRRVLRWLLFVAVCASGLASAGMLQARLVQMTGFALAGLVGLLAHRTREQLDEQPSSPRATRVLVGAMLGVPLVLGVLARLAMGEAYVQLGRAQVRMIEQATIHCPRAEQVVSIATGDPGVGMYASLAMLLLRREVIASVRAWHQLSMAPFPHRWHRTGDRSFALEPVGAPFLSGEFERIFRNPRHRFSTGDTVRTALFDVTVQRVDAQHRPERVEFQFHRSLEDGSVCFVQMRQGRLQSIPLPAVGATELLEHELGPFGM